MIILNMPYTMDPLESFSKFQHLKGAIFLDSNPIPDLMWPTGTGRYTFITALPEDIFIFRNDNPFSFLKGFLQRQKKNHHPDLPPFQGGLCGFFSYDLYRFLEDIPKTHVDIDFPDCCLGVYQTVLAWDHELKKCYLMSHNQSQVSDFLQILEQNILKQPVNPIERPKIHRDHTKESYIPLIEKVRQYIEEGDVYQINLARRWTCQLSPLDKRFDLYQLLRKKNPAPFSTFMNFDPTYILSSSPERFLKVIDRHVETRPIKGTCRRSMDLAQDLCNQNSLRSSAKDQSENVMIVDLLRNDLSKVCKPHSVKVPALFDLETYQTVHHLVSTVVGVLDEPYDLIDLLTATFPGGSITGAPKVRAMEIIRELEGVARGPYCGSAGYISFSGAMDTNILIRTFCIHQDTLSIHAGGGITYDSSPEMEFDETEAKAEAMLKTVGHT